jgi:hypothetical protein
MKNGQLNFAGFGKSAGNIGRKVAAYKALLFFVVVMALYAFIVWRINVFSNTPPSQSEETAQTTAQPHIDPATVAKIQSLKDNSVSVQTLFDGARNNPFNE